MRNFLLSSLCVLFIAASVLPAAAASPPSGNGSPVQVWLTNPGVNKWLSQEGTVYFQTAQSTNPVTIKIDAGVKYQQMEGFGAALTDSSAWLINRLSSTKRNTLMSNLFGTSTGIGLNFIRSPMGATDVNYGGNYSYDDLPAGQTDLSLTNFSIQHDQAYIIPQLKQALSLNPAIKIMATAWSPPGWMKTSGSMIGGTLKSGYESVLANYYTKFIQAYATAGVPIAYVTPQNEPMGTPTWPGMFLSAYQESSVIQAFGQAFAANSLTTQILAWDHNWDIPSYPETIFSNSSVSPYAVGTGWHVYSGSPLFQTLVHNDFPAKKAFITEGTGGTWQANDGVALNDSLHNWIINGTRNWANGVVLWNIALDPSMGPLNSDTNGTAMMHPLVTVDPNLGTVTYNVDYYALAHASKFVKPGAYRIYSNTFGNGNIEDVAFQNPDGSKVLIAHNSGTSSINFSVADGTQLFSYSLGQNAAVTLVWSGPTQSGTTPAVGSVSDQTRDFTFQPAAGPVTVTYNPSLLPLQNTVVTGSNLLTYSQGVGATIVPGTVLSRTGWIATASSNSTGSGSGNASGDGASNAIDGDMNTRWTNGHGMKNGDWFQINLGSSKTFNQIVLDSGPNSSFDYVNTFQVYVSNDGVTWGSPLASGVGRIGPVTVQLPTLQTVQYIRLVSTGTSAFWWSIGEINVYTSGATGSLAAPTQVLNGLLLQNWTSADGKSVTAVYNPTTSTQTFAAGSYSYSLPNGMSALFTTTSLSAYPTPAVSGLTPTSGVPGYVFTITGSNLGSVQGLGTVFVGSVPAFVTSWADSSITASVPQGAPAGNVSVTVNGTSGAFAGSLSFNVTDLGVALSRTGWVATASDTSPWGDVPAKMLDGDANTRWSSGTGQARGQWIQVDMGASKTFSKLVLDCSGSNNDYVRKADVSVSANGTTWTKVSSIVGDGQPVQFVTFAVQTARYIKVTCTGSAGNWWSVHELNVYSN